MASNIRNVKPRPKQPTKRPESNSRSTTVIDTIPTGDDSAKLVAVVKTGLTTATPTKALIIKAYPWFHNQIGIASVPVGREQPEYVEEFKVVAEASNGRRWIHPAIFPSRGNAITFVEKVMKIGEITFSNWQEFYPVFGSPADLERLKNKVK